MNNEYTDITLLLDRSGSMSNRTNDTLGGVNAFIKDQKAIPGKCLFTLRQFAGPGETVETYIGHPILKVDPIDIWSYLPTGNSTALVDSACRLIDETGARLAAMPEAERPGRVIIVIVTDGQENASHTFTKEHLRERIQRQEKQYNWQFIFQGTNQDAITEAASYGMPINAAMTYTNNSTGITRGYGSMSNLVAAKRMCSVSDMSSTGYSVDDYAAQADAKDSDPDALINVIRSQVSISLPK